MKKSLLLILFFSNTLAYAETFDIDGKQIIVDPPDGFVRVTEDMVAVFELCSQMSDPVNDVLAYYIPQTDAPAAKKGKLPLLEKMFVLKVSKNLKDALFGIQEFAELKKITKRHNKEIVASLQSELPDLMKKLQQENSKELDLDYALQISKIIPFTPHYETENVISYSMYLKLGIQGDEPPEEATLAATLNIVNLSGKVLFLYCYGTQENLEWTRYTSLEWVDHALARNVQPSSKLPAMVDCIDWHKVLEKGLFGAILGGGISLVFSIFVLIRKKMIKSAKFEKK